MFLTKFEGGGEGENIMIGARIKCLAYDAVIMLLLEPSSKQLSNNLSGVVTKQHEKCDDWGISLCFEQEG